jgi:hypothetical protein
MIDPMKAGNLDDLLARAREVPESSLPPGFAVSVLDRSDARRPWSRGVVIAWALAVMVLAGTVAWSVWSGSPETPADEAPPLPLFRAQDLPL